MFPELKESEDEEIKKALITYHSSTGSTHVLDKFTSKQICDWLEKQGDKDKLIQELGKYKLKYTQEVLEKHINSMSNKDDERLRKTTIAFLKDFAEQGYENAVECIDWLEKQAKKDEEILILKDKIESLHAAIIAIKETHKIELEKQGKQKSVEWHREDEQNLNACLGYIPDEFLRRWLQDAIHTRYDKPAEWSEEDEYHKRQILRILKDNGCSQTLQEKTEKWIEERLKSIKDRVQPQNLTVTDEELAQAKEDAYNDALGKIEYHSGEPTFDDGWSAAIWYLKKRIEKAKKD